MGFIADAIEDVGDFIGDTVEAIVDNPIGALVSVGGMALGIPPVYAGALGGAANAAANGGNILEGAITGGAMGYVGGAAGQYAAGAGAGNILAGAAGGAAAGATGALLTGQDIINGALTGGALGGLSGAAYEYILKPDGSLAPIEDRSSWSSDAIAEQNAQGNTVKINGSDGRVSYYTPDGALTTVDANGEIWSQDLDGNVQIKYADGSIYRQNFDGSVTGDTGWDLSQVGTTPTTGITGNIVGGNQPGAPAGTVPVPTTPVFPVITTPGTPTTPAEDTGTPGNYPVGDIQKVNPMQGVNPGFIAPTPFYDTTSPAQSQFYWGAHPFQGGATFNPRLYNMAEAPETPWGIQNIAQPLTPDQVRQAYLGQPIVQPQLPVATRAEQPLSSYFADHWTQTGNLPKQLVMPQPIPATQTIPVQQVEFVTGPMQPAPVVVQG